MSRQNVSLATMYLFQWLHGWWMTFWFFETMPAQGLVVAARSLSSLVALWGRRGEGGGSAVWGLAQSFSKSILALQALDNLENIIQNSPFQHVFSIKRVFSSRVSSAHVTQERTDKVKKKERKNAFLLSFSPNIFWTQFMCVCLPHCKNFYLEQRI